VTELRVQEQDDGAFWHVALDGPPGNVLDRPAIANLRDLVARAAESPPLKGLLFSGAGKHFSFGASIPDHLPGAVDDFLTSFGELFRELARSGVPCAAAVRGQCLGGGMELAAFCHFVFADRSARFAVPEVTLAVFPPPAAVMLPFKLGQTRADELILSGRKLTADEAWEAGLLTIPPTDGEPQVEEVALGWMREHLGERSAFALRHATRATRHGLSEALETHLRALEEQYLKELMGGHDPVEGLEAFLEKRSPTWRHD
jgi:cyclohexa-1,5-dienecarbonyl-CoA hydratase